MTLSVPQVVRAALPRFNSYILTCIHFISFHLMMVNVSICVVAEVVIVVCITAVKAERVHASYQTINFYMVGYFEYIELKD